MLRDAISGQEYDKEAILGGALLAGGKMIKSLGSGIGKLGSGKISKVGKNMKSWATNRNKALQTRMTKTDNLIKKNGLENNLGVGGSIGKSLLRHTKQSGGFVSSKLNSLGKTLINRRSVKIKAKKTGPYDLNDINTKGPTSGGGSGTTTTTSSTTSSTGAQHGPRTPQEEIDFLKNKNKKLKKKSKNNSLLDAYKTTKLHKNYGNTPLYAAGGVAAYAAGGGLGGGPTVVNNG